MKHRTLIIEDEKPARDRLKYLLKAHANEVEIVGEADNGEDGYQLINQMKPDLIFLDIEMPVYNAFEMLSKTDHFPLIIFITAFEEFAIKAFEENSIDYLLKPVEDHRLKKAMEKLNRLKENALNRDQLQEQFQNLVQLIEKPKKISALTVTVGDKIRLIKVEDIAYLKSDEKYTSVHDTSGKKHLVNKTLSALKEQLDDNFVQIHRSCIVNSDHIVEIRKGFKGRFAFLLGTENLTKVYSGVTHSSKLKERFGI